MTALGPVGDITITIDLKGYTAVKIKVDADPDYAAPLNKITKVGKIHMAIILDGYKVATKVIKDIIIYFLGRYALKDIALSSLNGYYLVPFGNGIFLNDKNRQANPNFSKIRHIKRRAPTRNYIPQYVTNRPI